MERFNTSVYYPPRGRTGLDIYGVIHALKSKILGILKNEKYK